MKALKLVAILAIGCGATYALAAFAPTRILNLYVLNKLLIGDSTESNAITRTVVADVDFDFASSTIVCTDSWAVTASGARLGDSCVVGVGPRDGGTQIVTDNSTFLGFVSAADAVKVRHCPAGTAANPVDAGYVVRCFSAQ